MLEGLQPSIHSYQLIKSQAHVPRKSLVTAMNTSG